MSSFSSSPPPAKPTAPHVDVESEGNVDQTQTPLPPPPGYGVTGVLRRWRHEDMFKRGSLVLRVLGFLFSVLAFVIMASNRHGRGRNFDEYEEYRYALAIAILSTLYTGLQSWRQIYEMSNGIEIISGRNLALIDFFGDQLYNSIEVGSMENLNASKNLEEPPCTTTNASQFPRNASLFPRDASIST